MSIADDVRRNFIPPIEHKPTHRPSAARSAAKSGLQYVKAQLVQKARRGDVFTHGIRALGLIKRTVSVDIYVNVNKSKYSYASIVYSYEDEEFCGFGVPDTVALYQLLYELRNECRSEGISVNHIRWANGGHFFTFTVSV